ncbi:MAG: hypothetical protein LBH42_03325 [Treponema sp.]|jgi:hypothetical protein|nr:hypothetical protein [Treponema sp.]
MKLHILTEAQEKMLDKTRHEYTRMDIVDLSMLSSAISSLVQVMILFEMHKDAQRVEDSYHSPSIFNILEMLIEPINGFFGEGAPMAQEE